MSAEVVDSNPYSRLMALQRMGIVKNYERIREFSVAIVVCICLPPFMSSLLLCDYTAHINTLFSSLNKLLVILLGYLE